VPAARASWSLPPDVVGQILERAREMGVLQEPDPEEEGARHDEAVKLLLMAEHLPSDDRVPEAEALLRLAEGFRGEPAPPLDDEPAGDGAVAEMMARERFPIPPAIEGDPPEMPRDLTSIGDRQCRRLHSEFNAWLARVQYLIGVERSDQAAADALAERHTSMAYKQLDRTGGDGKAKPATVLRAEAEADVEAMEWKRRAAEHGSKLVMLQALREIYAGNVERLSRDWRMRRDEFDMSGGGR